MRPIIVSRRPAARFSAVSASHGHTRRPIPMFCHRGATIGMPARQMTMQEQHDRTGGRRVIAPIVKIIS